MTTKIEELVNSLVKSFYRCNRHAGACSKGFIGICFSRVSCKYKELISLPDGVVYGVDFCNEPFNTIWVSAKDMDDAKNQAVELRKAAGLHTDVHSVIEHKVEGF